MPRGRIGLFGIKKPKKSTAEAEDFIAQLFEQEPDFPETPVKPRKKSPKSTSKSTSKSPKSTKTKSKTVKKSKSTSKKPSKTATDPGFVRNYDELIAALNSHFPQITLTDDIIAADNILINYDVTLDFNGFSIISDESHAISRVLDIRRGVVNLVGRGKIFAMGKQGIAIRLFGAISNNSINYTNLTVGPEISLFTPDSYGILISPNFGVAYGLTLNFSGRIFAHDGIGLAGAIRAHDRNLPTINLTETANIVADETTGVAIEAAGFGQWGITEARLSGAAAASLTAGALNFHNVQALAKDITFSLCPSDAQELKITIDGGTYVAERGANIAGEKSASTKFAIKAGDFYAPEQNIAKNLKPLIKNKGKAKFSKAVSKILAEIAPAPEIPLQELQSEPAPISASQVEPASAAEPIIDPESSAVDMEPIANPELSTTKVETVVDPELSIVDIEPAANPEPSTVNIESVVEPEPLSGEIEAATVSEPLTPNAEKPSEPPMVGIKEPSEPLTPNAEKPSEPPMVGIKEPSEPLTPDTEKPSEPPMTDVEAPIISQSIQPTDLVEPSPNIDAAEEPSMTTTEQTGTNINPGPISATDGPIINEAHQLVDTQPTITIPSPQPAPAPLLPPAPSPVQNFQEQEAARMALADAINDVRKLSLENYTGDYSALNQIVQQAEFMLSDPRTTLQDIFTIASELLQSLDSLQQNDDFTISDDELDELFYHGAVLEEMVSEPRDEFADALLHLKDPISPNPVQDHEVSLLDSASDVSPSAVANQLSLQVQAYDESEPAATDFSKVVDLLNLIADLDLNRYLASSQTLLLEALAETEEILNDPACSQEEVDDIVERITDGLQALELVRLAHLTGRSRYSHTKVSIPAPTVHQPVPIIMIDEMAPAANWSTGVTMIDELEPFVVDADTLDKMIRATKPVVIAFFETIISPLKKVTRSLAAGAKAGLTVYRETLHAARN